jgi:hypothetical protein
MEVMNSQNLTHKQAKQRVYGRVCEKVLVAFLICFNLFFGIKLKEEGKLLSLYGDFRKLVFG